MPGCLPQGCLSHLTLPCAVILLRSTDEKHEAWEGTACLMSHSHSGPGEDNLSFKGGGESQFHDSCPSSTVLAEVTNSLWSQDKVGKERHCHSKWSLALYHVGTVISQIRLLLFWEVMRRLYNSNGQKSSEDQPEISHRKEIAGKAD